MDLSRSKPGASRSATLGARLLTLAIVAYRRWISPALPARCRFYPSCSAYALEAVATHGALRGAGLAIWRLLRCHPFHPGGYDPVPARGGVRGPGRARSTRPGRTSDDRHNADVTGAES